jgi:UrcA family protein
MTKVTNAFSLRQILAPALLLTIAAAATPAGADPVDATPSVKVNYSDLDVDHAAGAKVLFGRIQTAAHKVCEPLSSTPHLQTSAWDKCVSNAVSNAVQSVGQPTLTSLYEEKTGKIFPTRFASLQVR